MGERGPKSTASLAIVTPTARAPVSRLKGPSPPKHLSADMRAWWKQVVSEFQLEPHHLHLLQAACEAWDRTQGAREALLLHGTVFVDDRGRPLARPEIQIERDSRTAFARLVRELDLDVEAPRDRSRPPALLSNRR